MKHSGVSYRDLMEYLQKLDQTVLDQSVTIKVLDCEFFGVQSIGISGSDISDILDEGIIILECNN